MGYYSNHYRQSPGGRQRPCRDLDNRYRRPQAQKPQPQLPRPSRRRTGRQAGMLLAGGSMLALAALVIVPGDRSRPSSQDICQQRVQSQSVLSRQELSQLLTVAERSDKETVRQIVQEPYCLLSPVTVREGVQADREAYPLEFDPQTWFVVLYEDGEYAGYDFSFHR